jgi:hypothetical protein
MVVMMHVVIMPVVAMMVTVPGHGSPDDRAGPRADDRAYGSADSRSGRTSDDSSADGVFASSRARRRGERNTESGDENRYTHRAPPLDGCRSSIGSKKPTGRVGHLEISPCAT